VLQPFQLHEPHTVSDASRLLAELGEDARAYAGGTELLLAMKQGLLRYGHLVNIKPLGLAGIRFDDKRRRLQIGATTTHRAVEHSDIVATHAPMLATMERRLANVRVRAVGTIGGNLCFAEPHSDLATVLLLHNATATAGSVRGERALSVTELLRDAYTTCLAPDELLLEIEVPELPPGAGASYEKVAFLERPSVGVGTVIRAASDGSAIAEARVAVGCVGPLPLRASEAERVLTGAPLRGRAFDQALDAAIEAVGRVCDPVDDLYGSAQYKRHLAAVLMRRTVIAARDHLAPAGEEA
jgi:carbon-monoxide dehydrogenase medium subunit